MAANTNWKYASVEVGKWKGVSVLAADTAWPCSPTLFRICPGLPHRFSKKCWIVPILLTPDAGCWVHKPLWTPPPREVEPKPSLYDQSTQATSTSEKPANIIANTLTAHFLGTIDAYSTASPGRLIRPTNVAAVICHVLSAGFNQLGYGT
jgi:hypothetical protein